MEKRSTGTYVLSAQQISKDKAIEIKQKAILKRCVAVKRGRPAKKKEDKKVYDRNGEIKNNFEKRN
jgi:hypothetical protein